MGERPPGQPDDVLGRKLVDARRRLSEADLPAADRARLQRQFIAVCDAVKIQDAGKASGLRRLDAFLSTLDEAAARNRSDNAEKDNSTT